MDGERAETVEIENRDPSSAACRPAAVGAGDLPGQRAEHGQPAWYAGWSLSALLGVVQPGQQLGLYKDALRAMGDRLQYLNSANNRYWFDTRPNLRREMEERKRRFKDKEDVFPFIRDSACRKAWPRACSVASMCSPNSGDIPDDWQLALGGAATRCCIQPLGQPPGAGTRHRDPEGRGDQPRQKQNRLIFMAADYDTVSRSRTRCAPCWPGSRSSPTSRT
jgi:hypothetical protein